ncbi:MAG: iron-sulfur cluster-binding domain-containing protein [Bacteroidetes bacterium]|nr:iron-sulfur cluster-binding domain-containing protein [Bacteroidota bacterium]
MTLRIAAIHEELPGVKTFFLEPADGSEIQYQAGQFLTFSTGTAQHPQRRSYSFSTTPGVDARPAITVKRVDNGLMSRWLIDQARVGDELESSGYATGLFTLPNALESVDAIWLFAAGIGITPIYSLLKALLHQSQVKRVVLLYSNHSQQHTVFGPELEALQVKYARRFELLNLWSNAQDLLRARLSRASFPFLKAALLKENASKVLCYLCGPKSYMWLLQMLLQEAGVPAGSVRREAFVIQKERHLHPPVDREAHRVELHLAGHVHHFVTQYPDSILKSALAAGIVLPYSCEAGQCGSCTAHCRSGKVWMSYDEVLTEQDLRAGRVLTCTGHAIGGDVVIGIPE